ncbi:MAG: glycyl-radical enzyme activating protein, partial [Clostridia bacterium]|nr:glycyl-radical enzyme activating protein [Clostridia bacterium]
ACHAMEDGAHRVRFDRCRGRGECVAVCPARALTLYGEEVSVQDILPRLLEDRAFYEASGGGVTLSGGEPLMQADFAAALLRALKEAGVHTALDTSGFAPWADFEKALPFTDLVLFDVKAASEEAHIACTGRSNRLILENLRRLDETGKTIDVRVPFVPGFNDAEMDAIIGVLRPLRSLRRVKILPYHNYADSKYRSLGLDAPLPDVAMPDAGTVRGVVLRFRRAGLDATDQTGDPPAGEETP